MARPTRPLGWILCIAVLLHAAAAGARIDDPNRTERGKIKEEYSRGTLAIRPLIVPIINDNGMRQQYLIRFDIILNDEGDREELLDQLPRIRNSAYEVLIKVVTFRTLEPRIPPRLELEAHLKRAIGGAVGYNKIKRVRLMMAQPGELPVSPR